MLTVKCDNCCHSVEVEDATKRYRLPLFFIFLGLAGTMKKLFVISLLLLLAGCLTTPVHTMTDTQLQYRYIELSSDLARYESQLENQKYKRRQPPSYSTTGYTIGNSFYAESKPTRSLGQAFQDGMDSSSVNQIARIKGEITKVRLEMSMRGMPVP